jgi:uncharacterized repeat protein (TIGR03899 family)
MGLITFEGKPIEKLIEVISQGIGTLYRPRAIRQEAKAKAYEIEVIEKAKAKAKAENKIIKMENYNAIEQRLLHQELKKQSNIENILEVAVEQISLEPEISSEPVDQDWTTRFFRIAEDISNDEMQKLWGRILSGEVKQPGSFSLRTLEILKNITRDEAELFTKFTQLKISHGDKFFVINYDHVQTLEKLFNIKYSDILALDELGLVNSEPNLQFTFPPNTTNSAVVLKYCNTGIYIEMKGGSIPTPFKVFALTKSGKELSQLIPQDFNKDYLAHICEALVNPQNKIFCGDIVKENGKEIIVNGKEFKI